MPSCRDDVASFEQLVLDEHAIVEAVFGRRAHLLAERLDRLDVRLPCRGVFEVGVRLVQVRGGCTEQRDQHDHERETPTEDRRVVIELELWGFDVRHGQSPISAMPADST